MFFFERHETITCEVIVPINHYSVAVIHLGRRRDHCTVLYTNIPPPVAHLKIQVKLVTNKLLSRNYRKLVLLYVAAVPVEIKVCAATVAADAVATGKTHS